MKFGTLMKKSLTFDGTNDLINFHLVGKFLEELNIVLSNNCIKALVSSIHTHKHLHYSNELDTNL